MDTAAVATVRSGKGFAPRLRSLLTNRNRRPSRQVRSKLSCLTETSLVSVGLVRSGRSSHRRLPVGAVELGSRLSTGQRWLRRPLVNRRQDDPQAAPWPLPARLTEDCPRRSQRRTG
jgi:hypothetical protein